MNSPVNNMCIFNNRNYTTSMILQTVAYKGLRVFNAVAR